MQARDAIGDGEPEPSAGGAAARLVLVHERLLHALGVGRRNARSPIEHRENDVAPIDRRSHYEVASSVAHGVRQQIVDESMHREWPKIEQRKFGELKLNA